MFPYPQHLQFHIFSQPQIDKQLSVEKRDATNTHFVYSSELVK